MKLNENGDFCLLYVEQTDDKQSLFEMIALQNKTVVLMLPLVAGQFRTRLFQRPEDFSDLKHLKRQTGVSVIFLTSGSELLAQMATRYGFSAYPSIDAFAEVLARGRRVDAAEGGQSQQTQSARVPRARTGPLVPSAAQIAAIKRAMPAGPLPKRAIPTGPLPMQIPTPEMAWSGPASSSAQPDYADFVSMSRAPTSPLHEPLDLGFWATPESIAMADAQSQGSSSSFMGNRDMTPLPRGVTPIPRGRESDHMPSASLTREPFFATEEVQYQQPRFSEAPSRRSSTLDREPYTPNPGWEAEEQQFTSAAETLANRSQVNTRQPGTSTLRQAPAPERPRTPAPVEPKAPQNVPQKRGMMPVLIILSILILGGAALGSLVAFSHTAPPTTPVATVQPVGTVMFVSSGQLNENTSQGIDDEVQITLHNLSNPKPGKSYYAWLLGDATQAESQSVLLGKLNFTRGSVNFLYHGDPQHTNLLQIGSRFLITEEDSAVTPLLPSPDKTTWLYYGSIPAIPDPNDPHHFAFLNHLRHLLADEPILDELELPGGLNSWFARNTQKLIEFTSNARDHWQDTQDMVFVRNEGIRILSYLDGMSFMVQDMPQASLNTQVNLDTHLAGLGLVNVRGATQSPGSYMDQITYHLNGLLNAPGSPANVRNVASAILPSMSDVNTWLQQLRSDDKQLLAMNDTQIGQPAAFALLNDMVVQASNAYSGDADPATGQFKQGVVWIHQQLQSLATINISTFTQGTNAPGLVPASNSHMPAFLLSQLAEWKFVEGLL